MVSVVLIIMIINLVKMVMMVTMIMMSLGILAASELETPNPLNDKMYKITRYILID